MKGITQTVVLLIIMGGLVVFLFLDDLNLIQPPAVQAELPLDISNDPSTAQGLSKGKISAPEDTPLEREQFEKDKAAFEAEKKVFKEDQLKFEEEKNALANEQARIELAWKAIEEDLAWIKGTKSHLVEIYNGLQTMQQYISQEQSNLAREKEQFEQKQWGALVVSIVLVLLAFFLGATSMHLYVRFYARLKYGKPV